MGRSGVVHAFGEVTSGTRGRKIIQRFSREITAIDVVATCAMVLDVGAYSVVLVTPSCTADARKLLEEYGMRLEIVP